MVSHQQVTSFPLTGHPEVASRPTVQACAYHFLQVFLPLHTLPVAAWGHLSDPTPWGTVTGSLTHFCCTEPQAGREDGLAEYGAIAPSLVVLCHTLPFLRPDVFIQGSEQMNPGPVPPWGALRLGGSAVWLGSMAHPHSPSHMHTPSHTRLGRAVSVPGSDLACTAPRHCIKGGEWRRPWVLGHAAHLPARILQTRLDLPTTSSLPGSRED